ncbi:MAG: MFS transporter [Rhizomicrobium sp.]
MPASAGKWGLLISLAIFGAGFITRPIGGIVLGSLGDRIGRKQVMFVSFVMIGIGMAGLALTPSYAQIGIAAPLIVLFFRLIQGFALGGEIGPTTAYLVESAPEHRRGFYGAMQFASQNAAVLIASVIGVALSNFLTPDQLQNWGWRAAFLAGLVIIPFGIAIRRNLPETLHAADDAALAPDATTGTLTLRARIAPYRKVIVLCFLLLAAGTVGTYLQDYMTTYALDTLHLSASVAFGATVVSASISMCVQPAAGILSDRLGRRTPMIYGGLILILLILPSFWAISHFHSVGVLYGCIGVMAVVDAFCQAPVVVALTEALPVRIRSGAVATVYAFAISIFGGSTQFLITWIIKTTHNPMAPAYYWTGAVMLSVVAAVWLPESAPLILRQKMNGIDDTAAAWAPQ